VGGGLHRKAPGLRRRLLFLVYPRDRPVRVQCPARPRGPQVVWPKNTSATAAAVAALAQCASSPEFRRSYPDSAARYLKQALQGWQFPWERHCDVRARRGLPEDHLLRRSLHARRRARMGGLRALPRHRRRPVPAEAARMVPGIPPTARPFAGAGGACPRAGATRSRSYAFAARSGRLSGERPRRPLS